MTPTRSKALSLAARSLESEAETDRGPVRGKLVSPFTLSVRYVLNLLEAARLRGLDREELCREAGIDVPDTDDPDVRCLTSAYFKLWCACMKRVGDPSFPLDVANVSTPETSAVLGFGFLSSPTFGEGLHCISKHLVVMTDGARWELKTFPDEARLALVRPMEPIPGLQYADEFAISHIVLQGRLVTGGRWSPREVRFRHPRPDAATVKVFRDLFEVPVVYGAPVSELVFDLETLSIPLPKGVSAIAEFFDKHLEGMIARKYPGKAFVGSLRKLMIVALSAQRCTLQEVARQLGVSQRTLSRRLLEEGVTFRGLLDEARLELAQRYLRDRRLSIGEIAFILGYSEPASFHHAFARWTGLTPSRYRQRENHAS